MWKSLLFLAILARIFLIISSQSLASVAVPADVDLNVGDLVKATVTADVVANVGGNLVNATVAANIGANIGDTKDINIDEYMPKITNNEIKYSTRKKISYRSCGHLNKRKNQNNNSKDDKVYLHVTSEGSITKKNNTNDNMNNASDINYKNNDIGCDTTNTEASVCNQNEVFSNCSNALCRVQNCTQKGQMLSCNSSANCTQGCICRENYLRDNKGVCIPEDQCEISCPEGEILSKCPPIDCDADNCPRTRFAPETCLYTGVCGKPKCFCGFNRRRNRETGKCIPVEECPPFKCIGPYEKYVACSPYCPGEQCLDYLNNGTCTTSETDLALACKPQCRCKNNYYRNATGICVKNKQCARQACPNGEMYNKCPPINCDADYCPQSRTYNLTCPKPETCAEGRCVCGFNRQRDRNSGECIPIADCPPFSCNGPNESYEACPPACLGESCEDYIKGCKCPTTKIGVVLCKPQCRCHKKYYRNFTGTCIENIKCV